MIIEDRSLLFTASIYDSYQWLINSRGSYIEKAYNDFMRQLTRASWTATPAIQRGMEFEKAVYQFAEDKSSEQLVDMPISEEFKQIVEAVRGGEFQKKLKKIETINGQSFCLYGKADVFFSNCIKDIKTTNVFKRSKYENSIQHKLYCYIARVPSFEYLVAEFQDKEIIQHFEKVRIDYSDFEQLGSLIKEKVIDFWNFIQNDEELLNAYLNKFCLY